MFITMTEARDASDKYHKSGFQFAVFGFRQKQKDWGGERRPESADPLKNYYHLASKRLATPEKIPGGFFSAAKVS